MKMMCLFKYVKSLRIIDNLDDIDTDRLDDLEANLAEAERQLDAADIDERLAALQEARQQQVRIR